MTMDTTISAINTPSFIDGLDVEVRSQTILLNLLRTLPARKRVGSFSLPPMITQGPTLGWLGEGEAKPVSDVEFDRDIVRMRKLATIIPMSDELIADSAINLPAEVRAAIVRAAAEEVERKLWNSVAETDGEPLGLIPQVTTSVAFPGAANFDVGLEQMLIAVRVRNFEPTAWAMSPAALHLLQTLKDLDGRPRYPEARTPGAPSFQGIAIRVTNLLPREATTDGEESTVVLGRFSEAECYLAPSSFSISDSATIVDGGQTIHLWQRDLSAIRYFQHLSDVRLRHVEAFAIMPNVETALP